MTDPYIVRPASLDDADALVRHRIGMFSDMGVEMDREVLARAFRAWLNDAMPAGTYRAWVVEPSHGVTAGSVDAVIAGGGITILPWPPGPRYLSDRLAFVYNVYVDPDHRRRGVARRIMNAIHAWCRQSNIASVALNASRDGQALYESMGYRVSPNPMMFLAL